MRINRFTTPFLHQVDPSKVPSNPMSVFGVIFGRKFKKHPLNPHNRLSLHTFSPYLKSKMSSLAPHYPFLLYGFTSLKLSPIRMSF